MADNSRMMESAAAASPTDATPTPDDAPARALTEGMKDAVRQAYQRLQENTPGFSPRRAQRQMIGVASRALATSGGVAAIQAPTGVGKSLGYLSAGVPIALASQRKLVISTGTVALQSQLVDRDIPAFLKATGLDARVALAKGRTRYLCPRNALELHAGPGQASMFGDMPAEEGERLYDRPPTVLEIEAAGRLLEALSDRSWDGDLDDAPTPVSPALRGHITTPASGCAGRRCSHAAQCPVLRARQTVREAQIVVTNHALLLSSLTMGELENGQPLLAPPGEMLLVLDEAHHLPGVAIDQGAARIGLGEAARQVRRMEGLIASAYRTLDKDTIGRMLPGDVVELAARLAKALKTFRGELEQAWTPDPSEREAVWRAPMGRLPDAWMPTIEALADDTRELYNWVHAAQQAASKGKPDEPLRERLLRTLGPVVEAMAQQDALWAGWRREDHEGQPPMARWIAMDRDGELHCHASPVSAAQVLRSLVWREVDAVVMTSATLAAGHDFRAFAAENGIPSHAEMVSLDSPFDLQRQAQLVVPRFPVPPDDREGHPREVARWLDRELDWGRGSMVLFTSRWKMEKVAELLPAARRASVLVQAHGNKSRLVAEHLERVAAGRGSVLFGLNSFGEGLDLPGEACTTVVITQVPFAVPTDPQTATLGEWLESRGHNPFNLIAVPQALRTLTQFAGRLIRTGEDTGRVVILDSRLLTRQYGQRILDALPPFERVIG